MHIHKYFSDLSEYTFMKYWTFKTKFPFARTCFIMFLALTAVVGGWHYSWSSVWSSLISWSHHHHSGQVPCQLLPHLQSSPEDRCDQEEAETPCSDSTLSYPHNLSHSLLHSCGVWQLHRPQCHLLLSNILGKCICTC